jgi:hypothetical protein
LVVCILLRVLGQVHISAWRWSYDRNM